MLSPTDINECATNPCDVNAQCEDTDGSFVCSCNVGFSGDGFDCTAIGEYEYLLRIIHHTSLAWQLLILVYMAPVYNYHLISSVPPFPFPSSLLYFLSHLIFLPLSLFPTSLPPFHPRSDIDSSLYAFEP